MGYYSFRILISIMRHSYLKEMTNDEKIEIGKFLRRESKAGTSEKAELLTSQSQILVQNGIKIKFFWTSLRSNKERNLLVPESIF
jgi:hypothetical protein